MHRLLICMPLLLAACSPPPAPRAGAPEDNVIGAPLEQSLDKARSVEDLGGAHKNSLDDAIDNAN